jgi:hypothetical protein
MLRYSNFALRINPSVHIELATAARLDASGDAVSAFAHLERAHILGQSSTVQHVRVHWAMFCWALRHNVVGETVGQLWRIVGAALKTWLWVPMGNTGGSNVSGFKPMPVPADLQRLIDAAHAVN